MSRIVTMSKKREKEREFREWIDGLITLVVATGAEVRLQGDRGNRSVVMKVFAMTEGHPSIDRVLDFANPGSPSIIIMPKTSPEQRAVRQVSGLLAGVGHHV